jgi:hypothetical protein
MGSRAWKNNENRNRARYMLTKDVTNPIKGAISAEEAARITSVVFLPALLSARDDQMGCAIREQIGNAASITPISDAEKPRFVRYAERNGVKTPAHIQ